MFCFVKGAFGLLATGLLLQPGLLAQRGGPAAAPSAHMGGAVHSAPSFSGASRSFAPPPGPVFASRSGPPRRWPSGGSNHRADNDRRGVGYRSPYFNGFYPGIVPFGYGLPFGFGISDPGQEDDTSGPRQAAFGAPPINPDQYSDLPSPGPEMAGNAPPVFRPLYQGPSTFAPVAAQPATTLIYKDGRAPMQVHNYALTASTLYALDGETRQEIPLSLLNVPATVEANRAAGVDFSLPVSR
jgi:hypothetical protein